MPRGIPGSGPKTKTTKRKYTRKAAMPPSNVTLIDTDLSVPVAQMKQVAWDAYKVQGMPLKELELRDEFEQWWKSHTE